MAASISAILAGLETRLATISGLNVYDYTPDNPTVPAAFPLVPAFDYRATMGRGKYTLPFRLVILVGNQLDRDSQHRLAGFANQTGTDSIRAAVEGDTTLGGIVDSLYVASFDPRGLEEVGLVGYLGGVFTVHILTTGT